MTDNELRVLRAIARARFEADIEDLMAADLGLDEAKLRDIVRELERDKLVTVNVEDEGEPFDLRMHVTEYGEQLLEQLGIERQNQSGDSPSEPDPAPEPPIALSGVATGSSSVFGDATVSGPGRVHENVSIRELADFFLLRDALRAGGSVVYDPGHKIHETEYLPKVLAAAKMLEERGYLAVEQGFMGGGPGPLRLTLTESGRIAAEEIASEDRQRREAEERRRSIGTELPAAAPEVQRDRLEPAIAIAWDPAAVTAEEYAELVEILGNLARIEGAKGVTRVRSQGLEVPALEGAV
jgi:hypothetical protein